MCGFLRGCLACDVGGRERIQNMDAKDNSYQTRNGCLGFSTARPVTVTVEFSLVYCSNAKKKAERRRNGFVCSFPLFTVTNSKLIAFQLFTNCSPCYVPNNFVLSHLSFYQTLTQVNIRNIYFTAGNRSQKIRKFRRFNFYLKIQNSNFFFNSWHSMFELNDVCTTPPLL